jgi:hypothetical protein
VRAGSKERATVPGMYGGGKARVGAPAAALHLAAVGPESEARPFACSGGGAALRTGPLPAARARPE